MGAWKFRIVWMWIGAEMLTEACVPPKPIDGDACPCPAGTQCCEATQTCRPIDVTCPDRYPVSSRIRCEVDRDCPAVEICWSWRLDQGPLAGPKECRKLGVERYGCAEGERREWLPHDGLLLKIDNLLRACGPIDRPAGCEGVDCSRCTTGTLGETFCLGNTLQTCLIALHPSCGPDCKLETLKDCGADCEHVPILSCVDDSICSQFDCLPCNGSSIPQENAGRFYCAGLEVRKCAVAKFPWGAACTSVCLDQSFRRCSGVCDSVRVLCDP